MNTPPRTNQHRKLLVLLGVASALFSANVHAQFKCQGADGKIEYSDRLCDTSKNTLDKPRTNAGVQTRPIGDPMAQLEKLFTDYEPRLCEREKLDIELDAARREGAIAKQPTAWRVRQDRQIELNEVLVDFQMRVGKITKAAGNDSKEMAALRKFQLGLKKCDPTKPAPLVEPTAEPKVETKTAPKPAK